MVSPSKVEVIKQVIEEVGPSDRKTSSYDDEKHDHFLSRLLSQLEKLESEPDELPSPAVSKSESTINGDLTNINNSNSEVLEPKVDDDEDEDKEDKIVKELKKLNRQSFITNCLLSAIIVLTVTWQISQVSIILKVKDGVTHPFRSVGCLFMGMIKHPKPNGNSEDTDSSTTGNRIESSPVHSVRIPEFQRVELPNIDFGFI